MSDALRKDIPISQPTYCKNDVGEVISGTVMYDWMHLRAVGPNCLKDNKFCGENTFLDDVNIKGDLFFDDPHHATNIGVCDLADVDCSHPISNQDLLVYNLAGNNWTNAGLPAGAPVALGDLTDTILTPPHLDGQHLVYSLGNWYNVTPTIPSLASLTDTNIVLPTLDQHLVYDGLFWVNQDLAPINVSSIVCTELTCPAIAGDQNDYEPVGYTDEISVLLINPTMNLNITGLVHKSGCYMTVYNNGTADAKLKTADPASLLVNQFSFGTDITIKEDEAIMLQYLHSINRWCTTIGKH